MKNNIPTINDIIEESLNDSKLLTTKEESNTMKIIVKLPSSRECLVFNYSKELLDQLTNAETGRLLLSYDHDIISFEIKDKQALVFVISELQLEKFRNNEDL